MQQEGVGDLAQTRAGFVVVDGDGLLAQVGGGHHQRANARVGKEQMLQGRVRQKDAEPRDSRRNRGRDSAIAAAAREHNGARHAGKQCLVFGAQRAERARGGKIAHHDGQRLAVAVLALAETHDRRFIRGVDAEMKSADALDGEDLAGEETRAMVSATGSAAESVPVGASTSQSRGPQSQQALGWA